MKNKRLFYSLVLILLAAGLLAGCAGGGQQAFAFEKAKLETGNLTAFVVANGSVHATRTATLSWKISGQVGQVLAQNQTEVQEGQQLAELLESSLPTSILSAHLDLIQAQKDLADLQASRTAAEQARVDLAQAQEALDKATRGYNAVSNATRPVAGYYLDGARAEYQMSQTEVDKAQNAYDHVAGQPDGDPDKAVALKLLAQAKQKRDQSLGNLNYLLGSPSSLEVEKAVAAVKLAEAQVEDAQRKYDRLKNGVPADDLLAAQTRVAIAQATLDQAMLKAPFAGVITHLALQTGDIVAPDDAALTLEDQSHLYVDGQISEVDINRLKVGQVVEVSLDAVYGTNYPGKVVEIGASGVQSQGVVNFPVRVELLARDAAIKTGMTAVLRVQVEEVSGVLLIPNRAVRVVDGQRVVYVDKGGPMPVSVPVTLGVSSDTQSQLLQGDLKEGSVIVLNPDLLLPQQGAVTIQ